MSLDNPRLRGSGLRRRGPYPLGQIPDKVLLEIGKQVVHRLAVGLGDITGDDFGTIFAEAIEGVHQSSPLGVADVAWDGCAWSVKTVKTPRPFSLKKVRLISGRNSPDYSVGISDPRANPSITGQAVLAIWNERVNQAMGEFEDLRIAVLVRNIAAKEFVLFEEEAQRFTPDDYEWAFNRNDNLEGRDKVSGRHCFTWQPHGSQFTILRTVPGSARQFSIGRNVPSVDPTIILDHIRFQENWVRIHSREGHAD
jgi:hypothetical protein